MSIQLPVYTIGFGDVYREFFNAVAATIGSKGYGELIKIMLILGAVWTAVTASIKQNHFINIKFILAYIVLMSVILVPNATVIVRDETQNNIYSVDHIPLGLGIIASLTSRIGMGFTELVESVFHMPNDLNYSQSGMLMGAKIISAAGQFQIVGGQFQQNMQSYVQQCVFYDVLLHKYSLQELSDAPDLWEFVATHASPARAFLYNHTVMTCQQGVQSLAANWKAATQHSADRYAHLLFYDNHNALAQLLSYLPLSYQYLANLSDDASSILQQNMMIAALQDGMSAWSSSINAESAMQNIAYAKAQETKRSGYHLLFRLAVYWLPLTKAVMELTLLGVFLIIVLFVFFPFGQSVIKNYVMTFIWLQLWAPIFAFENFILTYFASFKLGSATLTQVGRHALTLTTFSTLNQMNADLGNIAGFFAAITPIVAAGVFKGMMSVYVQAANYIGGNMQSGAFNAANEAVSGNMSLGNTQFSNHNANNTSSNHFNTSPSVSSDMMTYQLDSGASLSIAPSGEKIFNSQGAISQLPVSIHMSDTLRTTFSQMADQSESTAWRDVHSAQESFGAGLRSLYELGDTQAHSESVGHTSGISTSGAFSSSVRQAHQLIDRFAHDNNINHSQATRILSAVYGDAHATGSFNLKEQLGGRVWDWATGLNGYASVTGGFKREKSFSDDKQHSELFQKGEAFSRESNFSQVVDNALRATRDDQFRTGSEDSDRLAHNLASSFEQGDRYSQDAMNSFEKSQSYRSQASLVEESQTGINTQASQEFVSWLQKQPSIKNHGGGMGANEIMNMMQNDTALAKEYADQFILERRQAYINQFERSYSSRNIERTYQENSASVARQNTTLEARERNDQKIAQAAAGLNTGSVKDTVTPVVDSVIGQTQSNSAKTIDQGGEKIRDELKQ